MDGNRFIKDFQKLYWSTPQIPLWMRQSENCEYGDLVVVSKNSYLCYWCSTIEDCFYCYDCRKDRFCMDCSMCEECELCYECVDCVRCYGSNHLQDCKQCIDCMLCFDCIGCSDCFGCTGLRRKSYYIFNEPYSKGEYEKKLAEVKKLTPAELDKRCEEIRRKTPRIFMHQLDNENSFGDYLYHCRNCYYCFDAYNCEDSMYVANANFEDGTKNSLDCGPIANTLQQCYDCCFVGFLFNCKHIFWCDYISDCQWCYNMFHGRNCMGCVYVKNKEYHFLNEPLSKSEYEKLAPRITNELYTMGIQDFYGLLHYGR